MAGEKSSVNRIPDILSANFNANSLPFRTPKIKNAV
ncbi:hypothetical protein PARMER_02083 [Parabacteroides merdae ATCC 43184]|nr:hypothetical protein PARMER_02083 [Parabacteroides merdae ATCC 43184]